MAGAAGAAGGDLAAAGEVQGLQGEAVPGDARQPGGDQAQRPAGDWEEQQASHLYLNACVRARVYVCVRMRVRACCKVLCVFVLCACAFMFVCV